MQHTRDRKHHLMSLRMRIHSISWHAAKYIGWLAGNTTSQPIHPIGWDTGDVFVKNIDAWWLVREHHIHDVQWLYTLYDTLYTIRYNLYTIRYTLQTIRYTLYTIHYTLYTRCTITISLNTLYDTLYTIRYARYTLHNTRYTLYAIHNIYTLYIIRYTRYPYMIHYTPYATRYTLHAIRYTPYAIHGYLDGSSDNFGALTAKLVVRDIETRHLAIERTSPPLCPCPKSHQYCCRW
jgi:hypothetical protein